MGKVATCPHCSAPFVVPVLADAAPPGDMEERDAPPRRSAPSWHWYHNPVLAVLALAVAIFLGNMGTLFVVKIYAEETMKATIDEARRHLQHDLGPPRRP
jgi:hypothetical protein